MRLIYLTIYIPIILLLTGSASNLPAHMQLHGSGPDVVSLDVSGLKAQEIDRLKTSPDLDWWAEFGDTLVIGGQSSKIGPFIRYHNLKFWGTWSNLSAKDLNVVFAAHSGELPSNGHLIARGSRVALMSKSSSTNPKSQNDWHSITKPFVPNITYVRAGRLEPNLKIWNEAQLSAAQKAINAVDPVRWYLDVGTLSNWNRHVSSVDVVSARDWIKDQLAVLGPSSVQLQKFNAIGRDAWNVIATFDAGPATDIYIVGGHYDSISERPSESAPGAEDNASGAAGVIELARVFSEFSKSATLVFVAFSGEEQGLIGSKAFVKNLDPSFKARIKAVLNMDMIGYSKDESEDVLLESASQYKSLVDQFAVAAKLVEGLKYYITFNPYGSDHMPFIDNKIPAILTIDNDWGDYPSYHRSSDTIDKVSRDMGAAILRMNAGALAGMIHTSK